MKSLIKRSIGKILSIRTIVIWLLMAAASFYFFNASSGRTELIENQELDFMCIFLPLILFGAWAVMAVYFDLISSDREHKILDCILCSGITKKQFFLSKIITVGVVSILLAFLYIFPVAVQVFLLSGINMTISILGYFIPLCAFIMVFASIGIMISIVARASKTSMIWSLAIGFLLMPRFYVMMAEKLGNLLHMPVSVVELLQMISPGIMMNHLMATTKNEQRISSIIVFLCITVLLLSVAYFVFARQDEYNYGE